MRDEEQFEKTKYVYDGFKIYELKCSGAIDKIKKFSSLEWFEKLFSQTAFIQHFLLFCLIFVAKICLTLIIFANMCL